MGAPTRDVSARSRRHRGATLLPRALALIHLLLWRSLLDGAISEPRIPHGVATISSILEQLEARLLDLWREEVVREISVGGLKVGIDDHAD
jgi:hypothetical protein